MILIKRNIKLLLLLVISLALISWGYNGHDKINYNASLSFTPDMYQFMAWSATLAAHASDADDRKATDPDEGPRHYIDIDNYPGFSTSGRIPQTYDSAIAQYGEVFVTDQGILPWATHKTYDSLVNCFARFDWEKAVLFASDLGHYVADGHMPLHITRNYNGQYSGNYGIHSRYESAMINEYINQISYSGDDISFITDVNGYIFYYLYASYLYIDSVLAADDYALGVAGNTYSDEYKEALWEKSRGFTIPLFSRASHALAELIYSAWVEAGKPDMNSGPGIFENIRKDNSIPMQTTPNPFNEQTRIQFTLHEGLELHLQILNADGVPVETLVNDFLSEGSQEVIWNTATLPPGIYYILLEAGKFKGIQKAIRISEN